MGSEEYSKWAENKEWSLETGGDTRVCNVAPDLPDYRDFTYTPPLIRIKAELEPPDVWVILDQQGGRCLRWLWLGFHNQLPDKNKQTREKCQRSYVV